MEERKSLYISLHQRLLKTKQMLKNNIFNALLAVQTDNILNHCVNHCPNKNN